MGFQPLSEALWELIQQEIEFTAQRSRGPGGQNVNRTNSSVQLRWSYSLSLNLNEEQKQQIQRKLASFITKEDLMTMRSDVHRDQEMNKKECLSKLKFLIEKAFFKPKTRKATRPTKSSQTKRRENKRRRGDIKKSRSAKWD